MLLAKIAGAVAQMGYQLEDVKRVTRLVGQNLGSVQATGLRGRSWEEQQVEQYGKDGERDSLEEQVRKLLSRLLKAGVDPEKAGAGFYVNSNEPVLLVDTGRGYRGTSRREMEALMTQIVGQLRRDYNLIPVRVYAAGEGVAGMGGGKTDDGFGITILNVVNSNLGGPSMIQLLDAPYKVEGWNAVVTKEEWEQSDGSVERTVELAMKNWGSMRAVSRIAESSTELGNTQRGPVYGSGLKMEGQEEGAGEGDVEDDVVDSDMGQENVTVSDSAAFNDPNSTVAGTLAEDYQKVEIGEDQKKSPYEQPDQDPSKSFQVIAQTNEADTVDETERSVIEDGTNEAIASEIVQVEENRDNAETTDIAGVNSSSEGDFEMVHREAACS